MTTVVQASARATQWILALAAMENTLINGYLNL